MGAVPGLSLLDRRLHVNAVRGYAQHAVGQVGERRRPGPKRSGPRLPGPGQARATPTGQLMPFGPWLQ